MEEYGTEEPGSVEGIPSLAQSGCFFDPVSLSKRIQNIRGKDESGGHGSHTQKVTGWESHNGRVRVIEVDGRQNPTVDTNGRLETLARATEIEKSVT